MPFAFIILLVFSLSGLWCSPFSQPSSHLQFLPSSSTTAVRSTATQTSLLNDLLSSIEAGDYLRALSSDAARLFLQQLADDESSSADRVYSELLHHIESFLVSESEDDEDKAYRALLVIVISIAVATFLAFTQCNMTGWVTEKIATFWNLNDKRSNLKSSCDSPSHVENLIENLLREFGYSWKKLFWENLRTPNWNLTQAKPITKNIMHFHGALFGIIFQQTRVI